MKVKTFLKALTFFPQDLNSFEKFLTDKRLTQSEKDILHCWLLLRDGEYDEILSKVEKIVTLDNFVESQKYFLLGTVFINLGNPQEAIKQFNLCLPLLNKDLDNQIFAVHFHIFIAYLNLKDVSGMSSSLDTLKDMKLTGTKEINNLNRAYFNYFAVTGNTTKANAYLRKIDTLMHTMHEAQKIFTLTDKFNFYLKHDDFKSCEKVLDEMKQTRKFQLKANYKFMRSLLDYYVHSKSLYLYENDFKTQGFLFQQVKFLISFECADIDKAQQAWNELQKYSPQTYLNNFVYEGDKCLFQMVLKKMKDKQSEVNLSLPSNLSKNELTCLTILKNGQPVTQELLFKEIWKAEASTKDEFTRLRKLISRLRSKFGFSILSKKGTYLLASETSIKKAS